MKGGQKSVNITPGQYYTVSNSMAKWSKPGADGKNNFLQGCPKYTGRAVVIHHSFSILSDDRSKASSKTIPPHSAI